MKKSSDRKSVSEIFAETIIEELKQGTAPWQKPWKAGECRRPMNPITGTVYKGVNAVMLARHGYTDPRWMTMKQANDQEWRVKKGSKAQQVVFWQWTDKQTVLDDSGKPIIENGEEKKEIVQLTRPRLHVFSVFHASQLQTIEGQAIPAYEPPVLNWDPIERGEEILQDSGASITHDQADRAFYKILADEIHLPPRENFPEPGNYYSTALHELGHWSGHPSRMGREFGPYGSELYAKEELRAEIASWMLNQELGLPHQPDQHISYVDSWVAVLQKDPHEIIRACRDAEKIKEYVMELEQKKEQTTEPLITSIAVEINRAMADTGRWDDLGAAREANRYAAAALEDFKDGNLALAIERLGLAAEVEAENAADVGLTFTSCQARLTVLQEQAQEKMQTRAEEPQQQETLAQEKTILNVPYKEKDAAKMAGAKWDRGEKRWYAPKGTDLAPLQAWLPSKPLPPQVAISPTEEFARTLKEAGLIVDEPLMDGQIHRVPVENGKSGAKDGAYCGYADGKPNGWGQNYKTGEQVKWLSTGHVLTAEQKETLRNETAARLAERETERQAQQAKAKKRAYAKLMNASELSEEHPYLRDKGVEAFNLKQDRHGNLLVPGIDLQTGRIQTLQWIKPDGTKGFEEGCPQKGAAFAIPTLDDLRTGQILIAEGYATAATLHMATAQPVVVAFNALNLLPVAEKLHEMYPQAEIVICADNDHHLQENIGIIKAQEAAQAVGGKVVVPSFTKEEKSKKYTDFNDLGKSRGLDAVAQRMKGQVVEVER